MNIVGVDVGIQRMGQFPDLLRTTNLTRADTTCGMRRAVDVCNLMIDAFRNSAVINELVFPCDRIRWSAGYRAGPSVIFKASPGWVNGSARSENDPPTRLFVNPSNVEIFRSIDPVWLLAAKLIE